MIVSNNDLFVFMNYYIRRNSVLIKYLNGTYFNILITHLQTHAISNYTQERLPVGVFVEGHQFFWNLIEGVYYLLKNYPTLKVS